MGAGEGSVGVRPLRARQAGPAAAAASDRARRGRGGARRGWPVPASRPSASVAEREARRRPRCGAVQPRGVRGDGGARRPCARLRRILAISGAQGQGTATREGFMHVVVFSDSDLVQLSKCLISSNHQNSR